MYPYHEYKSRCEAQLDARAKVMEQVFKHSDTWLDRPQEYWSTRLLQELWQLNMSMLYRAGRGQSINEPGAIDYALIKIGSIAINWLAMRMQDRRGSAENKRRKAWRKLVSK